MLAKDFNEDFNMFFSNKFNKFNKIDEINEIDKINKIEKILIKNTFS